MITKVTSRMKQLQEELALESVTNIEFEESSRRSFEFLTEQVRALKETCNTLTDTFLQELEHISGAISGEFWRLEEGLLKDLGKGIENAEKGIENAEKGIEKAEKGIEKAEKGIEKVESEAGEQMRKIEQLERQLERKTEQLSEQFSEQFSEQLERKSEQLERKSEQLEKLITQKNEQLEKKNEQLEKKNEQLEKKNEQLEKRIDHLTEELESVLNVVPKIEDNMLRTNQHFQDRLEAVSEFVNGQVADRLEQLAQNFQNVSRESATSVKHLEHLEAGLLSVEEALIGKVQITEDSLREEFEQKHLKFQRHVTRQLEGMNRVLTSEEVRSSHQGKPPQITTSNMGGGTFGSERAFSPLNRELPTVPDNRELPREQAWSVGSDQSPLRIPAIESRRANVGERRDNGTGTASLRSGLTGSGYEAFRADRIGLGSTHDRLDSPQSQDRPWQPPRQSSRRGNVDDAPNAVVDLRSGFGGQDRPYLGRKDPLGPAQVGATKPGHIQVDFDLSGLQGASPASRGLH